MRKKELEKCEQDLKNCFSYQNGYCGILLDTHFKRKCPFYKTKEQFIIDRDKYQGD